jgi:release factor glutamine methyltransferase
MPATEHSVAARLAGARRRLADAGIGDAGLVARLIVAEATGLPQTDLLLRGETIVGAAAGARIAALVDVVAAGMPVHRAIGRRGFHGLELEIGPATLEPRPDTESLVDLALPMVRNIADRREGCRILDLGTGTGAIALSLLAAEPRATALATDISAEALAVARRNAETLGLADRFSARVSNWFSEIDGVWDAIVSNPPYISSNEIAELDPAVRDHDPLAALDGGADGLAAYRVIASEAGAFLEAEGFVAVEIGYDQKAAVSSLFEEAGLRCLGVAVDLGGHDRALAFGR